MRPFIAHSVLDKPVSYSAKLIFDFPKTLFYGIFTDLTNLSEKTSYQSKADQINYCQTLRQNMYFLTINDSKIIIFYDYDFLPCYKSSKCSDKY